MVRSEGGVGGYHGEEEEAYAEWMNTVHSAALGGGGGSEVQ